MPSQEPGKSTSGPFAGLITAVRQRVRLYTALPVLVALALLAGLTVGLSGSCDKQPRADSPQVRHKVQTGPYPIFEQPQSTQPAETRAFEEDNPGTPLELMAREIDLALLQTVAALGFDPARLRVQDVQTKHYKNQEYHFQTLALDMTVGEGFVPELARVLHRFVDNAELHMVRKNHDSQEWLIAVLSMPTHRIKINIVPEQQSPAPAKPAPAPEPKPGGQAMLVVIIDDLGQDLDDARRLAGLPIPLTMSVLPDAPFTAQTAELARKHGRDVLMHQPMEPLGYPDSPQPGPGALFVGMDPEHIRMTLNHNLDQVPQAIGVNNHMGSAFTQAEDEVRVFLSEVNKHGLFFIDSLTTEKSKVKKAARDLGLDYLRRDVFLDNVQDVQAILLQLRKAERIAISRGKAVAIGHPYPETIIALEQWAREMDVRVAVAPVSDLVKASRLASK